MNNFLQKDIKDKEDENFNFPIITFKSQIIEDWLRFIQVKPSSQQTYRRVIKQFLIFFRDKSINQISDNDIFLWREYLIKNLKPATVQLYLAASRMFLRFLIKENFISKNIFDHIKSPHIERTHRKDYLTANQCKFLINSIDTSTEKGLRNKAILALMMTTGLRTIEVARANFEDLRVVGNFSVLYIQGKGKDDKSAYVKLSHHVEIFIRDYLKFRNIQDADPLFVSTSKNNKGCRLTTRSISSVAKNAMRNIGIDDRRHSAHSLRHTAATLALLNGEKLANVQQTLRHSNINTTMIYAHALEREKNNCELTVSNAIFQD